MTKLCVIHIPGIFFMYTPDMIMGEETSVNL